MSGSKASRNTSSIINRPNGGGSAKLGGLSPGIGKASTVRSAYRRAVNIPPSRQAFNLLGSVCRKPGAQCNKAINSSLCQDNPACKRVFPLNQ